MTNPQPQKTKTIIRDAYTERLLAVSYELVKRNALAKRKDFANAIGVSSSFLNGIEARISNYPKDEQKRKTAETNLLHKFYVNPDYLQGKPAEMFVREPEKVKQELGEGAAKLNFRDKKVKADLVTELEAAKARIKYLEEQLNHAAEDQVTYSAQQETPNPDKNPDKKENK